MTVPSFLSVSPSTITSSGTFAVTLANETANTVFAGPTTGAAQAPTFRTLVAADIPNLDASKITTGQLAPANGGTGINTSATSTGSILYTSGAGTWTTLAPGSNTQVLTLSGGVPTWAPAGSTGWLLTGNATSSAYNGTSGSFLGTTSAEPLVLATTNTTPSQTIQFYTKNTEQMRLDTNGRLGLGTGATVNTQLDVTKDIATRELSYTTTISSPVDSMLFDAASPPNQTSLVRIGTQTADFTINGIAGGASGKFLTIDNFSGKVMTIGNKTNAKKGVGILNGGSNVLIQSGGSISMKYSAVDTAWVVNAINVGTGSPGMRLMGTSGNNVVNNNFYAVLGETQANVSENLKQIVVNHPGTVCNFYVRMSAAPGFNNGNPPSQTLTLRINGVNSALTVTISNSNSTTTGTDVTHFVHVNTGDLVSLQLTQVNSVAANITSWSMDLY
jgi:hypothetical protein